MTTQSVLDSMTAGILDRKSGRTKATDLTPVAGEKPRIPDVPEVFLTNEAVTDVARGLRVQAALLVQVADALDRMTGEATQTAPPVEDEVKQREREADARVAAIKATDTQASAPAYPDYAQLQREAQKAVFSPDIDKPPQAGSVTPGWECPTHGARAVEEKTSKRGRKYRVCTKCPEFEK